MIKIRFLLLFTLITLCSEVQAYIGPGMGGGIVAVTLGLLMAIVLGLFGILYYPVKRYLKKRLDKDESSRESDGQ